MATRNIVPRADNEGQIGTQAKKWCEVNTGKLRVRPSADNANVLEVLDASGQILMQVDTINKKIIANSGVKFKGDGSELTGVAAVGTGGTTSNAQLEIQADADGNGVEGVDDVIVKIAAQEVFRVPNSERTKTPIGATPYLRRKHIQWLNSNGFGNNDDFIVPHQLLPNNYAILDKNGNYHWMVEIPRKNWDSTNLFASSTIHPAFTVQGAQKRIFIGKYQASVNSAGQYVTHANQNVKQSINFDSADAAAQSLNDGSSITGFHLMTNAEWALIALISKYLNTMPSGNNNYGRDVSDKFVTGVLESGYEANFGSASPARWLAGSGGVKTSHDGTPAGIFDMNGNVWEWVRGLRLQDGEIQILPDNDAAANLDVNATSSQWKAIKPDGSLVAPGTAGTLKYDSVNAGTSGNVGPAELSYDIANSNNPGSGDNGYTYNIFESLAADAGITVPEILKSLLLFPYTTGLGSDGMWVRNYGERLPVRGGLWNDGANAGVFSLNLSSPRSSVDWSLGFRLAFAL